MVKFGALRVASLYPDRRPSVILALLAEVVTSVTVLQSSVASFVSLLVLHPRLRVHLPAYNQFCGIHAQNRANQSPLLELPHLLFRCSSCPRPKCEASHFLLKHLIGR